MKKILFLVSGGGGTFRFIHTCIKQGLLPNHEICGVVSNKEVAALSFARRERLCACLVQATSRNQKPLLDLLDTLTFDIAITTFHLILDAEIIERYHDKLLNVHPSFLPAFKGLNGFDDAYHYGCKFIGTTVHELTEDVDAGKILAQSVTPVYSGQTYESIYEQVYRSWCLNLLNVLLSRAVGGGIYENSPFYGINYFNPPLCFDASSFDEVFWDSMKAT